MGEKDQKSELPWLTSKEKKFCRLYIKYEEDHAQAGQEVYVGMQDPRGYATILLKKPKIQHFLDYLRQDAYETVLDENGRQALTVSARARDYQEMIKEARDAGRYTAAATLKSSLDALVGRKKLQAFNLAHIRKTAEKRQALFDAIASGDIDDHEFSALNKAVESESGTGTISNPVRVAVVPANDRVVDKSVDVEDKSDE